MIAGHIDHTRAGIDLVQDLLRPPGRGSPASTSAASAASHRRCRPPGTGSRRRCWARKSASSSALAAARAQMRVGDEDGAVMALGRLPGAGGGLRGRRAPSRAAGRSAARRARRKLLDSDQAMSAISALRCALRIARSSARLLVDAKRDPVLQSDNGFMTAADGMRYAADLLRRTTLLHVHYERACHCPRGDGRIAAGFPWKILWLSRVWAEFFLAGADLAAHIVAARHCGIPLRDCRRPSWAFPP